MKRFITSIFAFGSLQSHYFSHLSFAAFNRLRREVSPSSSQESFPIPISKKIFLRNKPQSIT
jgi:hypothetical protein